MEQIQEFFRSTFGVGLLNLVIALSIIFIGILVAWLLATIVRRLLGRVDVDNRIAKRMANDFDLPEINLEQIIGSIVFWLVILFAIYLALQQLNLAGVSAIFNPLITEITTNYIPGIVGAIILVLIAWVVAVILKAIVLKICQWLKLEERLTKQGAVEGSEPLSVSEALGTATFWLVILIFIPAILDSLGISAISEPFQQSINAFFAYLPNIVSAIVIFLVGWLVARILRQLVTGLFGAIRLIDNLGERIGLTGEQSLSKLLGTITYAIVMLIVLISALDALAIEAISGPATSMLTVILNAIPAFIGAVLVLVIAYYIAKLVSQLIVELLTSFGFDKWPAKLGINYQGTRTPSQLVGYFVLIGIILFAAVGAADLLNSPAISLILTQMVDFFFRIVIALIIVGIGLYFANLAEELVRSAGGANTRIWAFLARIAILVLAIAMALREIGVANEIVTLAFGLIVGAIAVAAALAFGLGGRDVAGQQLERVVGRLQNPPEEESSSD